ncbi:MAG TPA: hypothetical protein VLX44_06585 [Xanthobacteraceae bacterium]|nr:hypothetical protein [Xanthobacteraceae bacterium]
MTCDPFDRMRRLIACAIALAALAAALPAAAQDADGDCTRFAFDTKAPAGISRVAAGTPRAYFVHGRSDAAACPSDAAACRSRSYLVSGDIVLTGAIRGAFTCITYQNLKSGFIMSGWTASASLAAVAGAPAPRPSDWTGTWRHPGGKLTIKPAKNGTLAIAGAHSYPVAGGVRNTEFDASAAPGGGILAFADDGTTPFDRAAEGSCLMRMRRVETLLVVEDNGQCGDGMVSFTGAYQRGR